MMTYSEALNWLYLQKKSSKRTDLSRIKFCIEKLNIMVSYKVIHIAGTNGKGSTASLIYQLLLSQKKSVGIFISPFVISFNERIEANGKYISDEEVVSTLNILKKFALKYQENYADTIPFFELTFLMALMFYQKQNLDYLVLECGLGGRLDATNVLDKQLSIITNIGLEHTQQLGQTLEEIAFHKLGITRPNIACLTMVDDEIIPYFKEYAKKNQIPIFYLKELVKNIQISSKKTYFTFKDIFYETTLLGKFQAYNASLAIQAIQFLLPNISKNDILSVLNHSSWPGRLEQLAENIFIDGAHNPHGIQALCESIHLLYPNRRIKVIFTALKDKDIPKMIHLLDQITNYYYFTTIEDKRATSIEIFKSLTQKPFSLFESLDQTIELAKKELKNDEILIITGSLHFISDVRKLLNISSS